MFSRQGGAEAIPVVWRPCDVTQGPGGVVFAAGSFDGVHLGHAALADAARRHAGRCGAMVWALAFRPHPLSVLAPAREPPLLTPGSLQEEALARAGFDGALFFPFTPEIAALTPREFVFRAFSPWLQPGSPPCAVFAGPNWRFGRGRAGCVLDLPVLSGGKVAAFEEPLLEIGGAPVSSTRVREAVRSGDMALAARLLGRPYRIREKVAGRPSRGVGTAIGAPTANIVPLSPLLPPPGVYALDVRLRGMQRPLRAVADFGVRPTFPDAAPESPVLEVHLLSWDGSPLYGAEMDIDFLARLRDERRFDSPQALSAQILADIRQARSVSVPCPVTAT